MQKTELDQLKSDLSIKAKNGIDFILSGAIIWFAIAFIWILDISPYDKSAMTFTAGGFMLPLALLMSKILKTKWKLKNNPLQSLGLWLNFAQLFYFPFLLFVFFSQPDYFVMTYAIITGAHFFPYAWFYNEKGYAVAAGVISVGALLIGLNVPASEMFIIAIFMGSVLLALSTRIWISYRARLKKHYDYSIDNQQIPIAVA